VLPVDQQQAAFRVAEAVRWLEIGVNSYHQMLLGVTVLLFGAAIASGTVYPKWLGGVGVVAGLGQVWYGIEVGHVGFRPPSDGHALLCSLHDLVSGYGYGDVATSRHSL
jgi:hypothetical protein